MFQFIAPPMPHFIVCGEDTYPAGGRHADRSNIGVFDLIVVTRGALYLEEAGKAYSVSEGCYLILRPDRSHRTFLPCDEDTHFYWLHFQTLGRFNPTNEAGPFAQSQSVSEEAHAQIETFSFYIPQFGRLHVLGEASDKLMLLLSLGREQSAAARWKQQTVFQDLMLLLQEEGGKSGKHPQFLVAERAAAFLRQHYKEPVRYKQLSEWLHFHENYIAICMKKTFGCTPLEYLVRYRVEQAKQLLIHTDDPIGSIAEETGFGSFPYFVRCFKRHAGHNPKSFRLQYRS